MSAISNSPLSRTVAESLGVDCILRKDGSYKIGNSYGGGDVTQEAFDAALAQVEASGVAPMSDAQTAAYDHLQSEGYGRDFGPRSR